MSVFYAFSNNRDETRNTYDKVCEKITNIIDVDNNDILNSNNLLDKIKNHINKALIFVADITPDNILNDIPLPNPNVMLELGNAINIFGNSNIILLCNEKISKKVPSMLGGFNILYYNNDDEDYFLDIVDKINEHLEKYKHVENTKGWETYSYKLSDSFISKLKCLLDINLTGYTIRINKIISQSVILLFCNNGYPRKIIVSTKQLYLKNKEICLSNFNDIYDELKHLELILQIQMLNK
jgi:hypothetical protein